MMSSEVLETSQEKRCFVGIDHCISEGKQVTAELRIVNNLLF